MLISEHILFSCLGERFNHPVSFIQLCHDCHCVEALFSPAAPLDPFIPANPCFPGGPCTPENVKTMSKMTVFVKVWEF